jgi:transcriptional regulator
MRDEPGCAKSSRADPWKIDDAPADFVGMQMRAIVGVEIPIRRIEGKWKIESESSAYGSRRCDHGI